MQHLLHERSATVFYDPIALDDYHNWKRRIAQLKQELRHEREQKRRAINTVQSKPLLVSNTTRKRLVLGQQ